MEAPVIPTIPWAKVSRRRPPVGKGERAYLTEAEAVRAYVYRWIFTARYTVEIRKEYGVMYRQFGAWPSVYDWIVANT